MANTFRELETYKQARALAKRINEISAGFPKEEKYSLTDQIRRSSRSVGAQIAEAWAKRRYEKHFISKLTDADGEQLETQHWVESAVDFRLLSPAVAQTLITEYEILGKRLYTMMEKADSFCVKRTK